MILHCDNTSAIKLAKNSVDHELAKHVGVIVISSSEEHKNGNQFVI